METEVLRVGIGILKSIQGGYELTDEDRADIGRVIEMLEKMETDMLIEQRHKTKTRGDEPVKSWDLK